MISSAVADATEHLLGIGYRGLKATAKVMPTLRVEEPSEFLDTPTQTVIQRAPQATIPKRVAKLKTSASRLSTIFEQDAKTLEINLRYSTAL